MAFPGTALPVRSQLFLGSWVDFADATLIRDPIRIKRGVPGWGVRADPSTCNLSLRNTAGALSPRLPTGPYYGLLGQNTPMRVVVDEASDTFARTSSSGWGTSSSGHTWAVSGGLASAYAVSGGNATIAISAVNSSRVTALNVSLADCDVVATYKPGVVATGAAIQMATVLRYQDDSNLYQAVLLFNTDSTVTAAIVRRAGGTNTTLAATATLGTYTASSSWRMRAKICGRVITLRAWDVTGDEPATFDTWAADNLSTAILTAGKIGTRMLLQTGNTNSLSVTVTTSNLEVVHHRSNTEVPEWPVEWDLSGRDVWSAITGYGLLQRVNDNSESFSPLRRTLKSARGIEDYAGTSSTRRAVAYWSLEEEDGTTVASSGLPGGSPMVISGTVDWGAVSSVVGSDALPDMMSGTATLTGAVPAQETLTGSWTVGAVFTPPTLTSTWTALSWRVTGAAFERFELRFTTGAVFELHGINGTTDTTLTSGSINDLASRPTVVMVRAQTSGSDTTYEIATTGTGYTVEVETSAYTAAGSAPGYPTQVVVSSVAGAAADTAGIGHVFVWDGWQFLLADASGEDIVTAVTGHAGDQAITRLYRILTRQEGIPFIYIAGSLDGTADATSELLGPQRTGTLSDLVDDVVVVDKGLLYEARDELAVVYQARRARYNLPVTLALNYATSGQVAPPFKPVEAGREVVNDLTIQRTGGASGRYEQRSGRKSVNAPPEGIYPKPRKKTLGLYNDSQPYQHAAWETIEATWDEATYPSVTVNMARLAQDGYTTVLEQAKRLDVGGRLTVSNPPAWLPPDLIDLHAPGLTEQIGGGERIGAHAWTISAATVPAGPWTVGVTDSSTLGKTASAGCELMVNRNSSDTAFTVHTTRGPKWATGAGLSIPQLITGERITATTIANVSPSFVAAGTAAHGNNASVSPGLPAGLAAGDVLLVLAGIRNSGTGFPNPPDDDFEILADAGNLRLFGKYAQTSEPTPTVTFTAGATNADTSAQCAAFRGVGLTVHRKALQLNGSAQNIAYPGLTVTRDNCLVVVFGWKQDDWTSVATLSGMTEIGEPDTATGDDQGLVWDFVQQTTAANILAGSFVVTGGASAISRGGVIALGTDVQTMTVTRSVNTVAKAQTARALISSYRAARSAL